MPPTPLWNKAHLLPTEQTISITIDNSSVFVPGSGGPQFGFRRTEFIAQKDANHTALDGLMEVGTSIFHFSIQADLHRLLNFTHEYQIVFIEPSDGTHVFGIQLGVCIRHCTFSVLLWQAPPSPIQRAPSQLLTLTPSRYSTMLSMFCSQPHSSQTSGTTLPYASIGIIRLFKHFILKTRTV